MFVCLFSALILTLTVKFFLPVYLNSLSDRRPGGWPRPPKVDNAGLFNRIITTFQAMIRRVFEWIRILPDPKQLEWNDPWNIAEYRNNVLVTLTLQDKDTEKCFIVSNYHMPCCYYAPPVMTIHVDLAAAHVQRLAASSNNQINNNGNNQSSSQPSSLPYILAGDWNIKPNSSSYRLLTTGQMDKGDPDWPSPKHGMTWEPSAKPMKSAYQIKEGSEPNFTNYARIGDNEPFIDTLDYIFLSSSSNDKADDGDWQVHNVKSLPHRDDAGGPFPNLDKLEPSDHILIAADLELTVK
jgi:2',5'-phosphodiesterase